jgi:serine protease Do
MSEVTSTPSRERSETLRTMAAVGLICGLIGGAVGSLAVNRLNARFGHAIDSKSVIVQENSAITDVVKKVSPAVVSITSEATQTTIFGTTTQAEGAGTGIIINADGLIMTNKHVVSDINATYSVFMSDGKEYKNAKVLARDSVNDIAFVKIDAKNLPAAELGDSSQVLVGQKVVAIGNALGQFQNTVTTGIISGLGRPITAGDGSSGASENLDNLLQTDAAINSGNSGGPLVNLEGQVIGMNTAIAGNGAQNIGFAIPVNDTKSLIASVKDTGKITRPYLGVRYIPMTKDFAASNNLSVTEGAYVYGGRNQLGVIPGSPAANAGVKDGDIITKINDDKIDSTHSPSALVGKYKVGDKIKLTIVRDGKEQSLDATLQANPGTTP